MKTKELKKLILSIIESDRYAPMRLKDFAYLLDIHSKKERMMLLHLLDELVKKQKIMQDQRGRYLPVKKEMLITGTFSGHIRGFGFVTPENSSEYDKDIFIAPSLSHTAMDQDIVQCRLLSSSEKKHPEGEVVSVVSRGNAFLVGRFEQHKNFAFVIPDNNRLGRDIFIPERHFGHAVDNDKVVVQITLWPEESKNPEGKIVEVLGASTDPNIDILSVFRSHKLPLSFSERVINESLSLPNEIPASEYQKRRDLRDRIIFTIDGDSAKDFDDAVSLSSNEDGTWQLGVHIADVSYYVPFLSEIDQEAYARSTSIYAINQVIPMLPFSLSNDLCSLKPDTDRLAFSLDMTIDPSGKVMDFSLYKSVIHSKARMTYSNVNALLAGMENNATRSLFPFKAILLNMAELASVLYHKRRIPRGTIDFDFPEPSIQLDTNGKPVSVSPLIRGKAERMIEEFMLIANETIAAFMEKHSLPFIYRNHPEPAYEKMESYQNLIARFGFQLGHPGQPVTGRDFQTLQTALKGTEYEEMFMRLMLRTMQQAVYASDCNGHYALGAEAYTHFTSPIRRYPDLYIHRLLSQLVSKKYHQKELAYDQKHVSEIAAHCSEKEREAEKIEREIIKIKMVQYMSDFIGQSFSGKISGVTSFGFFVELPNLIEGLVRLQSLKDDYYIYDEELYQYVGERFGRVYKLGQTVQIRVVNADTVTCQIDFELA